MKTLKNKIISSLFLFIFLVSCSSSEPKEIKVINSVINKEIISKEKISEPSKEVISPEKNEVEEKIDIPIEDNISVEKNTEEKSTVTEKIIVPTTTDKINPKEVVEDESHKNSKEVTEKESTADKTEKVEEKTKEKIIDNSFFTKKVNSIFSMTGLNSSHYGIKVVNLTSDKTLFERNETTSFVPASNTKLYTTGAAIKVLGENYKFKTRLAYSGEISPDGTLNGNLYIIGGGDPTLGSKYLHNRQFNPEGRATPNRINTQLSFLDSWSNEVRELGIKKINGKILVDNSHFKKINPAINTWEWGDMSTSFGAPPSGVNVLDNVVLINFRKERETTITPSTSTIKIENETINSNINKIVISAPAYANSIVALGGVNTSVSKEVPVPNPSLLLADLFKSNLEKFGIFSSDGIEVVQSSSNSKVFYTHYSPTLERIITLMNSYSVNLFAETLKLEIEKTLAKNRPISMSRYWYEILKLQGFRLYDGSGLSRYNRVTPNNTIDLLSYMHSSKDSEIFYSSLAVAGQRGTLQGFNKEPLRNNLHAKSGTLTGVKSYSGYIKNSNGDLLAFSLMVNLHGLSNHQITIKLEEVISEMYKLQ